VKTYVFLIVLLLRPLGALHAADAPIVHRVLCTDYKGNRVAVLSAEGGIKYVLGDASKGEVLR
jgi:hypothetical protein